MAKSKSGGTRSYIRGKIGADVYSIGKDGKGAKQQVVRSLAEVVSNPQTEAQMRGRMIMSTVMQAVSALSPIIDHSFDNVPNGQPAISEFISRNYALVKADVAAHPSSSNTFGLNKYQEKGAKGGVYVISEGSVVKPAALTLAIATNSPVATIALTAQTLTVGGLKAALGLAGGDYVTIVALNSTDGSLVYGRCFINNTLDDTTAITSENVASLFTIESNGTVTVALATNSITITAAAQVKSAGIILSKKEDSAWKHSSATMINNGTPEYTADAALPTYPTGASRFLNGGDI